MTCSRIEGGQNRNLFLFETELVNGSNGLFVW